MNSALFSSSIYERPLPELNLEKDPLVIWPFCYRTTDEFGASYGLSHAGYDFRLDRIIPPNHDGEDMWKSESVTEYSLAPGEFVLASTMEYQRLPTNVCGYPYDKSSLARRGLDVKNTVIEPGWCGYLTLELSNASHRPFLLKQGMAICQIQYELLDTHVEGYRGKYQNQAAEPTPMLRG